MKLFLSNPAITRRDRERLLPHIGNLHEIKRWIREDQPSTADLKRAVVMEVERGERFRRDAALAFLAAIQRYERSAVERKIGKARERITRRKSH